MSAAPSETVQRAARPGASVSRAWLRALELTAPIPRQRERVLPAVVDELGHRLGDRPALLSDRECFTYLELAERAAVRPLVLAQGVAKGDVVGLLMPNRPEYLAIWLGVTRVGGVVALLNTNLAGQSLAHCIQAASAKHLIVAAELADALDTALPHLAAPPQVWIHGGWRSIDEKIESLAAAPLESGELREITIDDRALCIFTSGSTGMPKAVNVSHAARDAVGAVVRGHDGRSAERSVVQLPAHVSQRWWCAGSGRDAGCWRLAGRAREVLGEPVLERHHPLGVHRGSVHRRALPLPAAPPLCGERDRAPPSARLWQRPCGQRVGGVPARFRIPQILEFYAATEGGISLFNVQGKPGAIGHIPPYLAHCFAPALVAFDFDKGEPTRNENGFCIRCGVNEPGEAIGKVQNDPASAGSRYEGYTSAAETEKRILRHVFAAGDAWVRTGDLMRQDEKGFFYFVDRIGDTFRWKGENVATSEVAQDSAPSKAYCMPASTESRFLGPKAAPGWRPSSAKARLISPRCTGISPSGCPPTRVRFFFGSVRRPS